MSNGSKKLTTVQLEEDLLNILNLPV